MQDIKILRNEGKRWREVRDLKYPEWPVCTVSNVYNRWSANYDNTKDTMSAAEKEDIRQWLTKDKTWTQIRDLRYPEWSERKVRTSFRRQPLQNKKERPKLTMSATDYADTDLMRKEGKNFVRIRDIKYPTWSTEHVRWVFRATQQARKRNELQNEEFDDESQ